MRRTRNAKIVATLGGELERLRGGGALPGIPTGQPLVYELDEQLKPLRHYYLGDEATIRAAMASVAAQGRAAR